MPSLLQTAFTLGEVSPLLHGRVDMAAYGTACRTLRNMILAPQGPALNRAGTEYMCEVKDSTKATRLIPFSFGGSIHYMLEFGNLYIRFHTTAGKVSHTTATTSAWVSGTVYAAYAFVKNGGLVYRCISGHTAAAGNEPGVGASWATYWVQDATLEIASPYLEAHLFALKVTQSASMLWITHQSYMPRTLSRLSATSWSMAKYTLKGGPFGPINDTTTTITVSGASVIPGQTVTLTASASLFDADHVDALFGFRYMHGQASYSVTCPDTGAWTSASYPVFGPWTIIVTPDKTKKLDQAAIYLERSLDNGVTWLTIYTWSPTADYTPIVTIGAEWDTPALLRFKRTSAAAISDSAVFALESQGALRWAAVRITGYTSATIVTGTLLDAFDQANVALTTWAEGAWSDLDGWPACCGFYEDRLVFAGTPDEPDAWWMSQPGDYDNFGQHIPTIESDMTSFTLLSRTVNTIESMLPIGDILMMPTGGGEWAVSGGQEPISPLNVYAHQHGYAGSAAVDPVGIGTVIIHAQALGGALRELFYDEVSQGYDGNNLSTLANHLTDGQTIKAMAYQQVPWSVVWKVLESGVFLLGLTYMRNQQVVAWHRHDTGAADLFESVASMPGVAENEVWFVVKRNIGGSWKRYIERLHTRVDNAIVDAFFVDCGITVKNIPSATIITGLGHLNGMAVAVLADGVAVTGKTVSGGQITLTTAAAKVHVGLAIQADFESLGAEYNAGDGTSMGKKKRVSSVTPRVYRTYGGQIGKDSSHLHDIQYRAADLSGGLFTGSLEPQQIEADWTREGRVFIRQDDPLPLTLIAIIPDVEHGG